MKNSIKNGLLIVLSAVGINSCIPDEDPITPFPRGEATISQVNMGSSYPKQIYFDLDTESELSANEFTAWIVGFADSKDKPAIIINYATMASVIRVTDRDYSDISLEYAQTIEENNWQYDAPSGNHDSLAISGWFSDGKVIPNAFLINNGTDADGVDLGYSKLTITNFSGGTYTIKFCNLNNQHEQEISVPYTGKFNYTYLSPTGEILNLEPNDNTWELVFTKFVDYIQMGPNNGVWRSVTGVLINNSIAEAALLPDTNFAVLGSEILADTAKLFTKARNSIGYDWKDFSFTTMSYLTNPNKVYLIRSSAGFYYLLHFIDFYDPEGTKGSPKFEYKKI